MASHTTWADIELFLFWVSKTQERIMMRHSYLWKSMHILEISNNIHCIKILKLVTLSIFTYVLTEGDNLYKGQSLLHALIPDIWQHLKTYLVKNVWIHRNSLLKNNYLQSPLFIQLKLYLFVVIIENIINIWSLTIF